MKTKPLIFMLLFAGIWCFPLKAQKLNPQIFNKYHSSVANRVYDILCQIPLNDSRQLKLAAIFQNEDSLISTSLSKGSAPDKIDSIRTTTILTLSNFFTVPEIEKCFIARHQSQFTDVLLVKKKVKLINSQIDTLITLDKEMKKKMAESDLYNADIFERQSLSRVLTNEQYNNYLAIKTKKAALVNAAKDWNEIVKFNIAQTEDSAKFSKAIINYNVARSSVIDRYQDVRLVRNERLREIERIMPLVLRDLENARKIQKKVAADSTQYGQKYKGTFQW